MKFHAVYMALAAVIIAISCGGRPQMQSAPDYGNKVLGTWEKVGIECDEAGINCKAPKATESNLRWTLIKDGTGTLVDKRGAKMYSIPITYTLSGNVITEKDSKGNLYESKILTITDTDMVLNQHFQGKWYVNKYQKAE